MQLSAEDKLLLAVVNLHSTANELEQINNLLPQVQDWERVLHLLIQHGSAPLLYSKLSVLNADVIPARVKDQLKQVYYQTLTRSMLLQNALTQVLELLGKNYIKVVALKGAYLSQELYGDIALRQQSDIDILVSETDGIKAVNLLREQGFRPYDPSVSEFIASQTEIVHYPSLVKNGVSVEVHIRLHRKNKAYAIDTAAMIQQAVAYKTSGVEAYGLSLYDLLVHLCVHIDKHFEGGHIQMKCFNDIINLLRTKKTEIDWQQLIERTRIHKSEKLVFKYLLLTAEFYSFVLPVEITEAYSPTLSHTDRERFLDYLHCIYHKKYHVNTHWQNIREIKSFSKQVRYFLELIFPPKEFMIAKYLAPQPPKGGVKSADGAFVTSSNYHIITSKYWWLWYGYRWWVGLKGIFLLLRKKG